MIRYKVILSRDRSHYCWSHYCWHIVYSTQKIRLSFVTKLKNLKISGISICGNDHSHTVLCNKARPHSFVWYTYKSFTISCWKPLLCTQIMCFGKNPISHWRYAMLYLNCQYLRNFATHCRVTHFEIHGIVARLCLYFPLLD